MKQARAINMNLHASSVLVYNGTKALTISDMSVNGVRVRRFKKDMIGEGTYVHPVHKWVLDVDEDRLIKWSAAFSLMRERGVDVEVPIDHSASAADNLGYVIDCSLEKIGGRWVLFGIIEVKGDNAIDVIERNKNVSLWIDEDYVDGEGNSYGEAIRHCSVVQQPVVPNQSDFVAIAASKGEQ
jgi:hypothetical protein